MISIVNSLRLMAEDWHSRIGYNEQAAVLSKAADRIAELERQITLLRDALEAERKLRIFGQSPECGQTHWESIRDMRRAVYDATEDALAATYDLSGLVICDAEPAAWLSKDGQDFSYQQSARFTTPLYEAKELGK